MEPASALPPAAPAGCATLALMSLALAQELIDDFAARTGLVGDAPPRRYLWTDAFAVRTLLDLHRRTGDPGHRDLALRLVDQVHQVLGRHRADDPRRGWISGLSEEEAQRHPTAGGLRIGKELPERRPDEPYDPRGEWDRDGQYLHYLTQWMQALVRVAGETGEPRCLRWARELARAAQRGFSYRAPGGGRRMVWKASIDLRRPLVPSMGHHDPLEALIGQLELETAAPPPGGEGGPSLAGEISEAAALCAGGRWATEDPLGIGGLLAAAARLARLVADRGVVRDTDGGDLLARVLADSIVSLRAFSRDEPFALPADHRLAFRELGLSIGLRAVEALADLPPGALEEPYAAALADLRRHLPLARRIEVFWSDPARRRGPTWQAHRDIDEVMLAASLAAAGRRAAA